MSDYEGVINGMAEKINELTDELCYIKRQLHEAGFETHTELIKAYARAASKLAAIREIAEE